MTDAESAVAQKTKTPFDRLIKGLDYTIRGLTLAAMVPVAFSVLMLFVMAGRNPLFAWGFLLAATLVMGVLAITAIDPQRFTRRLPVSGNMRLLLSRLPVYSAFLLGLYFLAVSR
jgi:hypothetical protein